MHDTCIHLPRTSFHRQRLPRTWWPTSLQLERLLCAKSSAAFTPVRLSPAPPGRFPFWPSLYRIPLKYTWPQWHFLPHKVDSTIFFLPFRHWTQRHLSNGTEYDLPRWWPLRESPHTRRKFILSNLASECVTSTCIRNHNNWVGRTLDLHSKVLSSNS